MESLTDESQEQTNDKELDTEEDVVNKPNLKKSNTLDSGMDEGSNSSANVAETSDDEDMISRKTKSSVHRILDDSDSEVSQDVPSSGAAETKKVKRMIVDSESEVSQDVPSILPNDTEKVKRKIDDSESEVSQDVPSSLPTDKEKEKRMKDDSESEVSQDVPSSLPTDTEKPAEGNKDEEGNTSQKVKKKKVEGYATAEEALEAVMNDSSDDEDNGPVNNLSKKDLFDDEHSDSSSDVSSSGSSQSDREDNDEGFDETAVDKKLLAKLKKGAAKAAPKEKRKSRREELAEVHSESQRMVRESRINLPYHQPAPKSINDFLARAKQKQEQYKVLRRGAKDKKAKIVEDILASTRIKSRPKTQEELDQLSGSDEDWNPEDDKDKAFKEKLDKRAAQETTDESSKTDIVDSATETNTNNSTKDEILKESLNDEDDLPDIDDTSKELAETVKKNVECDNKNPIEIDNSANMDVTENTDTDDKVVKSSNGEIVTLNKDESIEDNALNDENKHNSIESKEIISEHTDHEADNTIVKDNEQSSQKHSSLDSSQQSKKGKDSLAKLAGIDLDSVKPCLSGQMEDFISLEDEEEAPKHPGVLKLMDRLYQHSAVQKKKKPKDRDISIISKDKTGIDSEELKLQTFTYHVDEEEQNPLMKLEAPGAKLVALKEQLADKIKQKREMARQQRQDAYDLDNEAGAYDVEEEEVEMSDRSDTDIEDEEDYGEEEDEEEEEEDGVEVVEKERETNPFVDEEADEDDEDGDADIEDAEDEDDDMMNLKLDVSDDEKEDEDKDEKVSNSEEPSQRSIKEKKKESEFKEPLKIPEKPFSIFGGSSNTIQTQPQSGQRLSDLVMPVEDSLDLYGNSNTIPDIHQTQAKDTQSQDFSFFLEDSQSNMLDADGYLKTKSTVKKPAAIKSALDDLTATQDNMSDLLGLCSGKFVATPDAAGNDKPSRKSLFDDNSSQNPDLALLGLCSGKFPDESSSQSEKKGIKRKVSADTDDSIDALSDVGDRDNSDDELSGNEDEDKGSEEGEDTDQLDSEGEEEEKQESTQFKSFLANKKQGKILKEFVEEEAELSGSEFDSDENLDLAEEDDIMEVEQGDLDMKNINEDELRDEVGRAHFKQMIDQDKRDLLRFQEMYLPDGDLHSEGGGRQRRFRWSNMDDASQQDMFGDGSDGEAEHEENEDDYGWRKERFEREQFLKKQQEEKDNNESENSQFLKFGKVFLKKQCSVDKSVVSEKTTKSTKDVENTDSVGSFYKLSKQKRGSFLARSKESLAKIAEKSKQIANPSAGAKTSGKFTFDVISPEKEKENMISPAGKQRKAHVPKHQPTTRSQRPPQKKPKLDTQKSFTESSIFNHL